MTGSGWLVVLSLGATVPPNHATLDLTRASDLQYAVCAASATQEAIETRFREFEYVKEDVIEKLDGRVVTARESKARRVRRSPAGIGVSEFLGRDGQPLDAAAAKAARDRAEARLSQLANDPEERARALAKSRRDSEGAASATAAMPYAFELAYHGIEWLEGEPCWLISFSPKPGFKVVTREQATFQRMHGIAWIRVSDPAYLRLEADFLDNASIKLGPLATITRGSHMVLSQGEVEPGVVMTRALELDLRLRLLFVVSRSERRNTYYRDYRRVLAPATSR